MPQDYGSFKDFVESTGDSKLMELYIDFLATGDNTLLLKRLEELGIKDMSKNSIGNPIGSGRS